jgi:hypothetical protein
MAIQNALVDLGDITSATMPVAVLLKRPEELAKEASLQFSEGFDDLDYVTFSAFALPSGRSVALVHHKNAPNPGTEICLVPDELAIPSTLEEALKVLKLSVKDLSWIHPDHEKAIKYKDSGAYSETPSNCSSGAL